MKRTKIFLASLAVVLALGLIGVWGLFFTGKLSILADLVTPSTTTTTQTTTTTPSWSALGTGLLTSGSQGFPVGNALLEYNNQLIAGGYFTTAGGNSANSIAAWDGSNWSALGDGLQNGAYYKTVDALTVFNNNLIAGGNFAKAGGTAANNIAIWDGTNWSALGSGIHARNDVPDYNEGSVSWGVHALAVFDNKLIAGGYFTTADGNVASGILQWDGTSWSALGDGLTGTKNNNQPVVNAMIVYNNKLIVAGSFVTAGGVAVNNIAAWDGTSWSDLSGGMTDGSNSNVGALAIYNGNLIVGGNFAKAGGASASNIASWNGTSWSALGSGLVDVKSDGLNLYPYIYALTVYNGNLIAGGAFINPAYYIASWDGKTWSRLGDSVNWDVNGLALYGDSLIATGPFTNAGGVAVNYIAQWNGGSTTPSTVCGSKPAVCADGKLPAVTSHDANGCAIWAKCTSSNTSTNNNDTGSQTANSPSLLQTGVSILMLAIISIVLIAAIFYILALIKEK